MFPICVRGLPKRVQHCIVLLVGGGDLDISKFSMCYGSDAGMLVGGEKVLLSPTLGVFDDRGGGARHGRREGVAAPRGCAPVERRWRGPRGCTPGSGGGGTRGLHTGAVKGGRWATPKAAHQRGRRPGRCPSLLIPCRNIYGWNYLIRMSVEVTCI